MAKAGESIETKQMEKHVTKEKKQQKWPFQGESLIKDFIPTINKCLDRPDGQVNCFLMKILTEYDNF